VGSPFMTLVAFGGAGLFMHRAPEGPKQWEGPE